MIINNGFVDLFVKTTSEAAYASSLLKGKGDKIAADQAAVDKMRLFLNNIPMKGKIVIGEGEMDEAPMLYINELVGTGVGEELDIAVDPLEGTNLTAKNLPNAMSVLAVSKKDNLLHAPDTYMEKIAVGKNIKIVKDPSRFRPIDADLQIPDTTKFEELTGWRPHITFNNTMDDLLNYWRERINKGRKFLNR